MRAIAAIAAAAFGCAALATAAAGLSKGEYKAGRARIAAEYQADRQKCGAHLGHGTELCVVRARGTQKIARAELEAAFKPSPGSHFDAAMARAQAAYTIARKECEDQRGDARKACAKDASAARDRAKAEATAIRKSSIDEKATLPKPAAPPR